LIFNRIPSLLPAWCYISHSKRRYETGRRRLQPAI